MSAQRTTLLSKENIAESTMAFHFEKPAGMHYQAGQYLHWSLIDPVETDDEGTRRAFTIASAPYEPTIMATTRMRDSAYKRQLSAMATGAEVELDEPQGTLTLPDDVTRPAVFLVGGIGVTPVRSMVLQSTYERSGHRLFVFYSNHRPEDAPFLSELTDAADKNKNVTFVPTMTAPEQSSETWTGETGHITQDMIARYVSDLAAPIYYLSGPANMLESMQGVLRDAGVDDASIESEEFPGY